MSDLSEACPYHGKRWRGRLQCLVNKLRGNILPSELTKRVSIVLCCCKGECTPISEDLASENKTEAVIAQYDWLLSLK